MINKPAPGVAIHIDQISVTNYKRDRSWRVAADQEKFLKFQTFKMIDQNRTSNSERLNCELEQLKSGSKMSELEQLMFE